MIIEGNIITADDGKALRRIGVTTPTMITRVALSPSDSSGNWEDCEYGNPDEKSPDDVTEADKDAALTRLGVDMTEG